MNEDVIARNADYKLPEELGFWYGAKTLYHIGRMTAPVKKLHPYTFAWAVWWMDAIGGGLTMCLLDAATMVAIGADQKDKMRQVTKHFSPGFHAISKEGRTPTEDGMDYAEATCCGIYQYKEGILKICLEAPGPDNHGNNPETDLGKPNGGGNPGSAGPIVTLPGSDNNPPPPPAGITEPKPPTGPTIDMN